MTHEEEEDRSPLEVLEEQLRVVKAAIEELFDPAIEIMEAPKRQYELMDLVPALEESIEASDSLSEIYYAILSAVERERMKEQYVTTPSGRMLELGYSQSSGRKWDTDKLAPVAIDRLIKSHVNEDGEIDASTADLMGELVSILGVGYWKVGDLNRLDIDVSEYSEKRPKKFKAKLHRND